MKDDAEIKGTDSKSHLTKTLTGGRSDLVEERSEVNSPEELRWDVYNRVWAELVWPIFGTTPNHHFSAKVGKDRGSRKEYSDVLKGMYDEFRGFNAGLPLIEALEDQAAPNVVPKKRWLKSRGGEQ